MSSSIWLVILDPCTSTPPRPCPVSPAWRKSIVRSIYCYVDYMFIIIGTVVYNDASRRPDPTAFSKIELWHTDVSYELQPPSTTSLKGITIPEVGGDTIWSSGCAIDTTRMCCNTYSPIYCPSYALYSSLSPGFQKYLEGLSALHSATAQAQGARAAGTHVRRHEVETIHPVVRVHPATGWKSIYVNPGLS